MPLKTNMSHGMITRNRVFALQIERSRKLVELVILSKIDEEEGFKRDEAISYEFTAMCRDLKSRRGNPVWDPERNVDIHALPYDKIDVAVAMFLWLTEKIPSTLKRRSYAKIVTEKLVQFGEENVKFAPYSKIFKAPLANAIRCANALPLDVEKIRVTNVDCS